MNSSNLRKNAIFERRKWVGITSYCNNNCIFCLDGDIKNKVYKSLSEIKKELRGGIVEGCTHLILSGGEATIHPNFIDTIKLGKEMGYRKIQVITNGRMFAYVKFLEKAIEAGLNEITFSIHGHTKELHDYLTGVNGSFEQTIKAVKNAKRSNLIINADIVLNKKNVIYFPKIITFFLNLGINEVDILQIMPFGRAINQKESLFYDVKKNLNYIIEGFEIAKKRKAVLWTNRFQPEYLESYEELIQEPYKLLDEIRGRKKDFEADLSKNRPFKCYGERCSLCYLNELCKFIIKKNKTFNSDKKKEIFISKTNVERETVITKDNYKELEHNGGKERIFSLVSPEQNYKDYELIVPDIKNILPHLYKAIEKIEKPLIKNIPYCFIEEKYRKYIINEDRDVLKDTYFDKNMKLDIVKLTEDYINNKKVKSLRCNNCKFNEICGGIFQKYVMNYGFKELHPILK